jgi:2-oxoisovalerate dehydrogenase E1 component
MSPSTLEHNPMPTSALPDKDTSLALYRQMLTIRRCEEQLARCYQAGLIPGACHTYVGEEAIATGVCAHLRDDDAVFSTHRGHGHALAKGVPPAQLVAELFGKATGCSQGRGGSMHLFSPEVGMMGTSGIVGPCILQAAGAGYSFMLLGVDRVGVAFFGDGAVANGAFHEGINLATNWQLPVLFICENNLFATEIAFANTTRNPEVANRAQAYGLPGVAIDGNDVALVYEKAGEAIERARSGGGPTLIECKTYRTRPHAEGMRDGGYRTMEEIDAWKKRDPIATFADRLLAAASATQVEIDAIANEVDAIVQAAVQFAHDSPWPDPATVADHIFSAGDQSHA